MRKLWWIAALALIAGVACGDEGPVGTPDAEGTPFSIRSHCGVTTIEFEGDGWIADPPLSDDPHNPPPGWDENQQAGTMIVVSDTELRFEGDGGQRARFVPYDGEVDQGECN